MSNKKFEIGKSNPAVVPLQMPKRFHIMKAREGLVLREVRPGLKRWVKADLASAMEKKKGKQPASGKFPDKEKKKGKFPEKKNGKPTEKKKGKAAAPQGTENQTQQAHAEAKTRLEAAGYEVKKKPEAKGPEFDKKTTETLKKHEKEIGKLKPGASTEIGGVPVTKIDDDFHGVTLHGKKLVVVGATAAAALVQFGLTMAAATGAAMSGDFQGGSMGDAKQLGAETKGKITSGAQKATDKAQEVADKAAKASGKKRQQKKVDKKAQAADNRKTKTKPKR